MAVRNFLFYFFILIFSILFYAFMIFEHLLELPAIWIAILL